MNITEARQSLTKGQMDKLTEKALAGGPFVIENVRWIGSQLEVDIRYPRSENKRETIQL